MEALLELTASLSLEGSVTFPDPGQGVPADAVPSTPSSGAPAWPDVTALEEGSALPLTLVVLGEDDVIPGVTRAPVGAPAPSRDAARGGGVSSGEREAASSGAASGGRGGEEADMERLRKILRGLQVPPDGGAPLPAAGEEDNRPGSIEEESDLAAVEALLRAGTRL
jgi:hypothetical protein